MQRADEALGGSGGLQSRFVGMISWGVVVVWVNGRDEILPLGRS